MIVTNNGERLGHVILQLQLFLINCRLELVFNKQLKLSNADYLLMIYLQLFLIYNGLNQRIDVNKLIKRLNVAKNFTVKHFFKC